MCHFSSLSRPRIVAMGTVEEEEEEEEEEGRKELGVGRTGSGNASAALMRIGLEHQSVPCVLGLRHAPLAPH